MLTLEALETEWLGKISPPMYWDNVGQQFVSFKTQSSGPLKYDTLCKDKTLGNWGGGKGHN
jgi:hypothetical protein